MSDYLTFTRFSDGLKIRNGDTVDGWTYRVYEDATGVVYEKQKQSEVVDGLLLTVYSDCSACAELNGKRIASRMIDSPYWQTALYDPNTKELCGYDYSDTVDDFCSSAEIFAKKLKGIDNDELVIDDKAQRSR